MKNIKLTVQILFVIFLAVNAYSNTDAVWQRVLLFVASVGLILFFISDLRVPSQKKGD
jgi:hypothetical protein